LEKKSTTLLQATKKGSGSGMYDSHEGAGTGAGGNAEACVVVGETKPADRSFYWSDQIMSRNNM